MARRKDKPETGRVSLGDDLRIGQARATFDLIVAAAGAGAVAIDASRVTRIDAAGLQALVAGLARLRESRVECTWHGVSDALSAAAATAALEGALELP